MLSRELEETLRRAMSNAASRSHEFATLEHLLVALTDDADAREVLKACNVDISALGSRASDCVARACNRAIYEAEAVGNSKPGWKNFFQSK